MWWENSCIIEWPFVLEISEVVCTLGKYEYIYQ